MKKKILISITILVIVLGVFIWYVNKQVIKEDSEMFNSSQETDITTAANSNTIESIIIPEEVIFTHNIFDISKVSHITPLGELNGGYIESQTLAGVMINIERDANGDADLLDIYAPTDMELVRYAYYDMGDDGGPEWALYFNIADGVTMTMHHVREAGEKIVSTLSVTPKADSRTNEVSIPIQFEAGEYIARTNGTPQAHNWNIYVYDESIDNEFARQERYTNNYLGDEMRNATCPFDYYSDELRTVYESLYGYSAPGQSETCGSVSHDVSGTLSGLWYFSSDPSDGIIQEKDEEYVTPFSIYRTSDYTIIIYEIDGKRFDIRSDNETFKDPVEITGEHCYSLVENFSRRSAGYAYFKIENDVEMKVVYKSSGACPKSFPKNDARMYYR